MSSSSNSSDSSSQPGSPRAGVTGPSNSENSASSNESFTGATGPSNANNTSHSSNVHDFLDCSDNIIRDPSYNIFTDPSYNPVISEYTSHQVFDASGLEIVNDAGKDSSGNVIMHTTFVSTEPEIYDPNINQNLVETVKIYDDTADPTSQNNILLNEIKDYASKIQCSDFHGKGTIDDYAALFNSAARIANESKQIQLDINIDGFNEFGQAADDLSNLFANFIIKLENVNIINDTDFLTAISIALKKIWNLSEVFGRFKQTILTTTTIQIPKSSHETSVVVEGVMSEINCAMKYIQNFVEPTDPTLVAADLSPEEKNIISKAVDTIDNWNIICNHGVSIAMTTNPDVQYITNASNVLKQSASTLKISTQKLKNKLQLFMRC